MKNRNHDRRDLPALEFEDTDFPDLPARVPAGVYLEGEFAAAQWEICNRPWAKTEPMGLVP
jgi:hypothetical protein